MASAKPPQAKEPANLQSTRQMLDELDALMDRMLAIPVNDMDDLEPAPPKGGSPAAVRKPTVSATLTVLKPPADEDRARQDHARPEHARQEHARKEPPPLREIFPRRAAEPVSSSVEALPLPRVVAPPAFQPARQPLEPAPDPIPEELIPPPFSAITALSTTAITVPESPAPLAIASEEHGELSVPVHSEAGLVLPLVWFNRGFDMVTWLLGPLGYWLRGPRGRYLLGLTGLALLGAAGLWLVKDWLGWTW